MLLIASSLVKYSFGKVQVLSVVHDTQMQARHIDITIQIYEGLNAHHTNTKLVVTRKPIEKELYLADQPKLTQLGSC